MTDSDPDLADIVEALGVIEDALSTGFDLHRPSEERLAELRAITAAGAAAGAGPFAQAPPPVSALVEAPTRAPTQAPTRAAADPEALAALSSRALSCTACVLSAARKSVVFGEGVPSPIVLVVGEGPGAEEDNQGLPFVGASGKLLDKMLSSIGLSRRENCYIANIVKCRPPNNREPAPDERAACMPFLREQIRLLSPKAILCAGRTAAQALLATTEGINRLRGKNYSYEGIPLVATYHPSALLRDDTLKRPAWEDLKRLRDIIANE
jgi:uracil-DNA glycosylase